MSFPDLGISNLVSRFCQSKGWQRTLAKYTVVKDALSAKHQALPNALTIQKVGAVISMGLLGSAAVYMIAQRVKGDEDDFSQLWEAAPSNWSTMVSTLSGLKEQCVSFGNQASNFLGNILSQGIKAFVPATDTTASFLGDDNTELGNSAGVADD